MSERTTEATVGTEWKSLCLTHVKHSSKKQIMMSFSIDFGDSSTQIVPQSFLQLQMSMMWPPKDNLMCLTFQKSLLPSRAIPIGVTFHLKYFLYLTNHCRSCIVLCLNNSDTVSVLLGILSQIEKESNICTSQSCWLYCSRDRRVHWC